MKTYLKKGKSIIYSSLLKHGLSKFKLEILQYCGGRRSHPTEKCLKGENHYIKLLKPSYNINRFLLRIVGHGATRLTETIVLENLTVVKL
jgi:hypothetical protein